MILKLSFIFLFFLISSCCTAHEHQTPITIEHVISQLSPEEKQDFCKQLLNKNSLIKEKIQGHSIENPYIAVGGFLGFAVCAVYCACSCACTLCIGAQTILCCRKIIKKIKREIRLRKENRMIYPV